MPSVRARELLIVFTVCIIVAIAATLPLATHFRRALPSDLLDTLLNTWIIGWDADRFRHALAGIWDPPIFYPYPNTLAFSENLLGVAILSAPVYWVTGNAVLSYNVAFVLSFVVAAAGMYLLVRVLNGSRSAAWIGALTYGFGPFRMAQMVHIQMVATGWLPITLFALHRYLVTRTVAWLGLFVLAYAIQATSNSYVAFFLIVPVACIVIVELRRASGARLRIARDLAIAALALAAVMAPVAAHYYKARADLGQVRNQHELETFSADLRSYLVGKNTIGIWRWLPTAVPADPEKELFPGIVPVLLAIVAVTAALRGRPDPTRFVIVYACIGLTAVLLSLGPSVHVWGHTVSRYGPYGWLYQLVPGWAGMRVPARFAILAMLALAMLAGAGADVALAAFGPRAKAAATMVIAVLLLAEGWAAPIEIRSYPSRGRASDRAVADWLRAKPAGGVLFLPVHTENYDELHHQYVTLVHRHPIVNAYSGWDSPLNAWFKDRMSPLYDFDRFAAVVRMLRAAGIRYVALFDEDFDATDRGAQLPSIIANGFRASRQVVTEQAVLGATVFQLDEWPTPGIADAGPVVDLRAATVSVSSAGDRAANLVDGDPDTRWFADQDGDAWITVEFQAPQNIARVALQMATRSIMDYPRELRIESTDASGTTRTLYDAVPYPELITGFLRNAAYPTIAIALPDNHSRGLRIRETGVVRRWWSVHEVEVWRR